MQQFAGTAEGNPAPFAVPEATATAEISMSELRDLIEKVGGPEYVDFVGPTAPTEVLRVVHDTQVGATVYVIEPYSANEVTRPDIEPVSGEELAGGTASAVLTLGAAAVGDQVNQAAEGPAFDQKFWKAGRGDGGLKSDEDEDRDEGRGWFSPLKKWTTWPF